MEALDKLERYLDEAKLALEAMLPAEEEAARKGYASIYDAVIAAPDRLARFSGQ